VATIRPKAKASEIWESFQTLMKTGNHLPNFWMSGEYVQKANLKTKYRHTNPPIMGLTNGSMIEEKGTEEWFYPPITLTGDFIANRWRPIYCGFIEEKKSTRIILDYQYIYDPKNFLNLSGGTWKVFRKNIRKYPDRVGEFNLEYRKLSPREFEKDIEELVLNWGEGRDLYDVEVLVRYAFQGENRYALLRHGKVVGLNIFDENFKFINYRYCIDDGTPFLNEYMRYLFYTSDEILKKQKLVNDGGSLDNEGLRKFKLRLNPVHIGYVYSYS